jgi:hypothetical protein
MLFAPTMGECSLTFASLPYHKAEEKVKDLVAKGCKQDAENLRTLCACGRASVHWQCATLPVTPAAELQQSYVLLQDEKYEVPRTSRMLFSKKVAVEYADSGRWADWTDILTLHLPDAQVAALTLQC